MAILTSTVQQEERTRNKDIQVGKMKYSCLYSKVVKMILHGKQKNLQEKSYKN